MKNRSSFDNRFMSQINVVPFIDVMLVLLIIFMVAAPLVKHGVDVDLPRATISAVSAEDQHLAITITKERKIFLNQMEVELSELKDQLSLIFRQRADNQLFFRADKELPYEFVIQVMAEIKNAGIEKLGIITTPLEKK